MKLHTRQLTCAAIVGAAYAVLSIFGSIFGITYGPIQCRFSEALCVLPFLFPAAAEEKQTSRSKHPRSETQQPFTCFRFHIPSPLPLSAVMDIPDAGRELMQSGIGQNIM